MVWFRSMWEMIFMLVGLNWFICKPEQKFNKNFFPSPLIDFQQLLIWQSLGYIDRACVLFYIEYSQLSQIDSANPPCNINLSILIYDVHVCTRYSWKRSFKLVLSRYQILGLIPIPVLGCVRLLGTTVQVFNRHQCQVATRYRVSAPCFHQKVGKYLDIIPSVPVIVMQVIEKCQKP